jgi:hypothetical protein
MKDERVPMNESNLTLEPEFKKQLEQTLGKTIPDGNSLEFQTWLEELLHTDMELFETVMRHLTVTLPEEKGVTS